MPEALKEAEVVSSVRERKVANLREKERVRTRIARQCVHQDMFLLSRDHQLLAYQFLDW